MKGNSDNTTGFKGGNRYGYNPYVFKRNGDCKPGVKTDNDFSKTMPIMTKEDWDRFYVKKEIILKLIEGELKNGLTEEAAIQKVAENPRVMVWISKYREVLRTTKLRNTICSYEMVINEIYKQKQTNEQGMNGKDER